MSEGTAVVTVLLCGVGGQGTILAADVLAHAALDSGFTVKLSEVHGMSQRGGSVSTVVRFGAGAVRSMVSDPGGADCVVAFETTEALRNLANLRQGGHMLVADEEIQPLPVLIGRASMPRNARERLERAGAALIPARALARRAGADKSVNVVLLGALSTELPFPLDSWMRTIERRVPRKTVEANRAAFREGRAFSGALASGEGA